MAPATPPENPPDEPFSPSVFLDLPPTPNPNPLGDADDEDPAASSDDQVLPFIRRMLMEEAAEDDDILHQYYYPGHPALLQAEQPLSGSTASSNASPVSFADATWPYDPDELSSQLLLSSSAAGEEDDPGAEQGRTTTVPAPAAGDGVIITMDLLNQAFLKGMEEGSKFFPTSSLQPIIIFQERSGCKNKNRHSWDGEDDDLEAEAGRQTKLMAPSEPDESGEVADGVFNKAYEVTLQKIHGLSIAGSSTTSSSVPGPGEDDDEEEKAGKGIRQRRSRAGNEAVHLRTLLIHCAEAVNSGNRTSAAELLRQIKQRSSPTGGETPRRVWHIASPRDSSCG